MENFCLTGLLFHIILAVLRIVSGNGSTIAMHDITIAVILPEDNSRLFSIRKSLPAIRTAIETSNVTTAMESYVNFHLITADSKCDSVAAPLAAFDFYRQHIVHAFFGPICDYSLAPVARYSPAWNIPVITTGGMAHDFGANKTAKNAEYALLTRMGVTFDSLIDAIQSVVLNYSWKKVKILYASEGHSDVANRFCYLAISGLALQLRKKGQVDFHLYLFDQQKGKEEFRQMFKNEISVTYGKSTHHQFLGVSFPKVEHQSTPLVYVWRQQ